jgi:hypothetical protein
MALVITSATSVSGLTAVVATKVYKKRRSKKESAVGTSTAKEKQNDNGNGNGNGSAS